MTLQGTPAASVRARYGPLLLGLVFAAFLSRRPVTPRAAGVDRSIAAPAENDGGARPEGARPRGSGARFDFAPSDPASSREGPEPPSAADEEELLRLLDEARGEPEPVRRRERLAGICLRWAGFDPPGAIKLALDLGLDPLAGSLLPNLAQQWAASDLDSAQAWARRLPVGELRDDVYSRIVYERARREPARAAGLLAEMRPDGPARAEAALTVLHFWAERDPAAVSAWVAGWPAGMLRDNAIRELRGARLAVE